MNNNEPKADDSRLLTDREMDVAFSNALTSGAKENGYHIAKAQDAKTSSILEQKCQERVERIFREIEEGIYALELELRVEDLTTLMGLIVALKKQEGIDASSMS